MRTGVESRAELTFADLTITRLGANTIFSLEAGTREVELTKGTILIEVPSKAAPVKASTAAVTVAVMGGTALLGTGPPIKFMVLEGTGTMYPKGRPEKAVTVHGGEMVMMTADGHITRPTEFDVKLVLETSHLIVDFPPLVNLPLILMVMNQQLAEQMRLDHRAHLHPRVGDRRPALLADKRRDHDDPVDQQQYPKDRSEIAQLGKRERESVLIYTRAH